MSKHPEFVKQYPKIIKIWDKYQHIEHTKYTPLLYDAPQDENGNYIEGAIIFVGINPGFAEKDKANEVFHFSKNRIVNYAGIKYDLDTSDWAYFKAFRNVMSELKNKYENTNDWGHIDLSFFRETNQKRAEEYYYNKDPNVHGFIWDQLAISIELLKAIKPSVIVVCNAFACKLISNWYKGGLESTYNLKTGLYSMEGIPLLKAAMLSGQRAMDIGSRERLIWHISRVLKESK